VTEIPEHLLKRSRERRSALSGDESAPADTAGSTATPATPAAATPATTAAAAPPAKTPPPKPAAPVVKPDPPYVAAAKARPKIPWWAMATLGVMPIVLFMYIRGLTPQVAEATGPVADGAELFNACASCHSADGSGGAGRQLSEGDVLLTFPKIEWQLNLVDTGSRPHAGVVYGDPNRPDGPHIGLAYNGNEMPAQGIAHGGALTDAQILAVVCHERYDLPGNADPTDEAWVEEYEKWCSPDSVIYAGLQDGSLTFDSPEVGVGTDPIDFTTVSATGDAAPTADTGETTATTAP
jgi:mono/diheme cytochrome c family protein